MRRFRLALPLVLAALAATAAPAVVRAADADCHGLARKGNLAIATVTFDTGSTAIKTRFHEELRRIANDSRYQLKVCLIGQADRQGNADFNRRLAQKRAEAVRDLLVSFGAPRSLLVPMSVGEAYGSSGGNAKDANERRVEIHYPRRYE